jgi:shikimate kinase
MSVILIGYRGCGKTTVGKRLADRMWTKFVDTDELVAQAAGGKSVREIFEEQGERYFRDLEVAAVRHAVQSKEDRVISLGGGAILREETRQMLIASQHKRLYLRCEPAELLRRIDADPQSAANRPALTEHGGGLEEIEALMKVREPLYRQVATAELDVTHLDIDETMKYMARMV